MNLLRRIIPKKVTGLFAWYDLWIGVFWDSQKGKLYVLPIPCLGFVLHYGTELERKGFKPHSLNTRIVQS